MDYEKKLCCTPCGDNKNTIYDNLEGMPLAMAYVPWQKWQKVFDAKKGLEHGTIFQELVLPFYGAKAACANKSCNGRRGGRL